MYHRVTTLLFPSVTGRGLDRYAGQCHKYPAAVSGSPGRLHDSAKQAQSPSSEIVPGLLLTLRSSLCHSGFPTLLLIAYIKLTS